MRAAVARPHPGCPLTEESDYQLRARARPEQVAWMRAFAAAVGAAYELDPDTVADVKLAVSELVSALVALVPGAPVELSVGPVDGRLRYGLRPWNGPPPGEQDDLDPWGLVTALFDEVDVVGDRIEILVPLAASA